MTIKQLFEKYKIVTITQASSITGLSKEALNKRVQRGKLNAIKVGKTYLIFLKDVDVKHV
jgi:excisionase family DNA binding protein